VRDPRIDKEPRRDLDILATLKTGSIGVSETRGVVKETE
tara:strand:- start:1311 stop:1427 length:117 start_codon:yes stop_codon:yes gene_type:complete